MSDMLTHWAVFDDVRRISQHDLKIATIFKNIIQEEREYARLGALTRGGKKWIEEIIREALKQEKSLIEVESTERKKIAFAIGGITHYAADIVMKKICTSIVGQSWNEAHHAMQKGENEESIEIRNISAYYDVHVFKKVYLEGSEEPFNSFLISHNSSSPGKALEEFIRSLFQRALLSCHTLAPDKGDYLTYIEKLISKVQRLYIDIELYCEVFSNPDEKKMREYHVRDVFYIDEDPLIRIARNIQKNQKITSEEYEKAIRIENNRSGYALALAISIQRLRELTDYWNGKSTQFPSLKQ